MHKSTIPTKDIPIHLLPSSSYPLKHEQLNEPLEFVQLCWQAPISSHSLISMLSHKLSTLSYYYSPLQAVESFGSTSKLEGQ